MLTVGTGTGGFESLDDGDLWPLVYGPQGGVHLDVGIRAVDLDLDDLVAGQLEAEVDSRVVASSEPWLDFRCTGDSLQSWGTRLIFEVDIGDVESELADRDVTVRAELTDRQGTSVSGEGVFVIDNTRG